MFDFKVLTVRDLDFTDDQGRRVKGQQLWLLGPTKDPQWNGYEVLKVWIADGNPLETIVSQLRLDDNIQVTFDRRGKPLDIAKV